MNYNKKCIKYETKHMLLQKYIYRQIGGDRYFIVDPSDETLKEQKTFPYNNIDIAEEYGASFPEKNMLLWLKEKTEDLLINPIAPLDNREWDATKPNGLAYWMRLYPWGHGFTAGRNVLLENPRCHSLFPPNCSFLESFESKVKSKELAERLGINVAKQISFTSVESEKIPFNQTIAEWCAEAGNKLFFVLKPTSLALSEGVLIVIKNDDNWTFSVPPLALTPLWNDRFRTQEKLSSMIGYVRDNPSLSAYDVAFRWCDLHIGVDKKDWIVQELLPRVMEFHNQPMEIKAYLLGGNVWYAIHYVQPTTGSYIKHPFYYRKENKDWNCIKPPKNTNIIKDGVSREMTDAELITITEQLGRLVSEIIAPAAETIARTINAKFMMRADFFIVPDKKHIRYTVDGPASSDPGQQGPASSDPGQQGPASSDPGKQGPASSGPVWSLDSLASLDGLKIYFNEMQHWYGKAVFLEEYGNMFLYPIFQRTVNRLLKIGC